MRLKGGDSVRGAWWGWEARCMGWWCMVRSTRAQLCEEGALACTSQPTHHSTARHWAGHAGGSPTRPQHPSVWPASTLTTTTTACYARPLTPPPHLTITRRTSSGPWTAWAPRTRRTCCGWCTSSTRRTMHLSRSMTAPRCPARPPACLPARPPACLPPLRVLLACMQAGTCTALPCCQLPVCEGRSKWRV